ncbi:MAG: phenylalanine--tRNA ligase subunit beta [Patescibacteria group bacterium]|jgi:phenylalanyl-tRNA synthetase beta chain
MRFINKYLDKYNTSASKLAEIISDHIQEVEGVQSSGIRAKGVVTGKICDIQKHPNADRLVICSIDLGGEMLDIVTGAPNVQVGQIVPVALVGAEVLSLTDGSETVMQIKSSTIRGVLSNGMLCGPDELGLENVEVKGIHIFPEDTKLGVPAESIIPTQVIIETDDKGTGHRPELLSYRGLEADLDACFGLKTPYIIPNTPKTVNAENIHVSVASASHCSTFCVAKIDNMRKHHSPAWLTQFLTDHGVNPINLVTDITNYIMLKEGMPTHVFSAKCITKNQISVEFAKDSEKITVLNGKSYQLSSSDLVISSNKQALDIAGIIGGSETKSENDDSSVILTAGQFSPVSVRQTSRRLGLRTDASARFERGLTKSTVINGFNSVLELILKESDGKVSFCQIVGDTDSKLITIPFDAKQVNQILGTNLSENEMINILSLLHYQMSNKSVTPPWWRSDVHALADVTEDIARIYGYNKIDISLPLVKTARSVNDREAALNKMRNAAIIIANEVETAVMVAKKDELSVEIQNPIGDLKFLRTSLLPQLFDLAGYQYKNGHTNFNIFEFGTVYHSTKTAEKLPQQPLYLSAVFQTSEADLKQFLAVLLHQLHLNITEIKFEQATPDSATILYRDTKIGHIKTRQSTVTLYGFELNFEKIVSLIPNNISCQPYAKTPVVKRDLSFTVNTRYAIGEISRFIQNQTPLLLPIILFDRYVDKSKSGEQSLSFHLLFQDPEKTLIEDQVNTEMAKIESKLIEKYQITQR